MLTSYVPVYKRKYNKRIFYIQNSMCLGIFLISVSGCIHLAAKAQSKLTQNESPRKHGKKVTLNVLSSNTRCILLCNITPVHTATQCNKMASCDASGLSTSSKSHHSFVIPSWPTGRESNSKLWISEAVFPPQL